MSMAITPPKKTKKKSGLNGYMQDYNNINVFENGVDQKNTNLKASWLWDGSSGGFQNLLGIGWMNLFWFNFIRSNAHWWCLVTLGFGIRDWGSRSSIWFCGSVLNFHWLCCDDHSIIGLSLSLSLSLNSEWLISGNNLFLCLCFSCQVFFFIFASNCSVDQLWSHLCSWLDWVLAGSIPCARFVKMDLCWLNFFAPELIFACVFCLFHLKFSFKIWSQEKIAWTWFWC